MIDAARGAHFLRRAALKLSENCDIDLVGKLAKLVGKSAKDVEFQARLVY